MKKLGLGLLSAVIVSFVIGCASQPPATAPAPYVNPNDPPWLNERAPEDAIWGIGTANMRDPSRSRQTAENRARVSIARQLDSTVQAMFVDYFQEAGTAGQEIAINFTQDVSRSVTNINLAGARINQEWTAPDGTRWTRVEYSVGAARGIVSDIFQNQASAFAEFQADRALQMLDHQLAARDTTPVRVDD